MAGEKAKSSAIGHDQVQGCRRLAYSLYPAVYKCARPLNLIIVILPSSPHKHLDKPVADKPWQYMYLLHGSSQQQQAVH